MVISATHANSKMQTVKRTTEKSQLKEKAIQDATPRKKDEDAIKKTASPPKNYIQKTSTVDIYGQKKKNVVATRAPKKTIGATSVSKESPSKEFLKSPPSSVSQLSVKSSYDKTPKMAAQKKLDLKTESRTSLHSTKIATSTSARKPVRSKDLPFTNITVNSPIAKRKLNTVAENASKNLKNVQSSKKVDAKSTSTTNFEKGDCKEIGGERPRTKTRTLDENEVKVLTAKVVDNNIEMLNLSKRLSAEPKAFYVEIQDGSTKKTEKSSDDDVSYEDDFESYESDFESYHSDQSKQSEKDKSPSNDTSDDDKRMNDNDNDNDERENEPGQGFVTEEGILKEGKDEEKMLDSGNFDLRDRSAKSRLAALEFILEDGEEDKRQSLTDEGFQDMSSSSGVSTMKGHVDVLEKPLFIDFSKSIENKRKRKLNEQLKQRATDLLSMISLHEMSYNLFEMKPIPYDLFMATFGKSNYTQIAVQTFDDGITEEVQTEEIIHVHKWTQHPIEFSKHDIYLYPEDINKKYSNQNEDYLTKFTFLINNNLDEEDKNKMKMDKSYKENPLRIYFEQKDGVGSCEMLPYETYKNKIENNEFNTLKLSKFLKKVESRVSNILSLNCDKNLIEFKNSVNQKIPLSKGYITVMPKTINNEKLSFLKDSKISHVIFSETKSNLLLLIHKNVSNREKCIICLWDVSVARKEPIKILIAIDNVLIGRFRGNTDAIFVAALDDGSLQLWDLSEQPTWRSEDASRIPTKLVEIKHSDEMTQTQIDREWNWKNVNVGKEQHQISQALQACAFTNSAANLANADVIDYVVGLEFVGDTKSTSGYNGGRKVVAQVCSLQRVGILTIWSIIQEKTNTTDKGKAYWSKMKLEKTQTISLLEHIDFPVSITKDDENFTNFNLNAAKRRLTNRKSEKIVLKKNLSRPKSTSSSEFDISRPASAASFKKVLSVEKKIHQSWESGILCNDLKIMKMNKVDSYLVAKNFGEVLFCTRNAGAVKVERFCVATDTSSVTCLGVSPHGLPYFLAATDSGTINLCSVVDSRVLLTLDCRNGPTFEPEKCQADNKGRFVSSSKVRSLAHKFDTKIDSKMPITFLHWSPSNPCIIYALLHNSMLSMWDLTFSDICAKSVSSQAAMACAVGDGVLVATKTSFTVIRGSIVKEIRQRFTDWATQVIRLYRGEEFVEFEWVVGPIPIGTDLGKEVVSIFSTNVTNSGWFYTDSNGRQMMKRTCWNDSTAQPHKKPVSACYYPVVSRLCLQATNTSTGLCVLTDRAQGGTSYMEGEVELMLHRRLLTDDGFGLEESLNEEAFGVGLVVKGKHRIVFGNARQEVEELNFFERVAAAARRWHWEPWLFMTAAEKITRRKWQNVRNKRYSALRLHGLPRHIHVLTLEPWKGGSVLLRLENTLEKNTRGHFRNKKSDGPEDFINKPSHISVQLKQLFIHLKIKKVRETTLAANQWLDDARQMDWSTRYVYQGADDDILAEDTVDYKDMDSKPKDRQEDEKDYKDPSNYSEEEEFNRRRMLKQKPEKKIRKKPNFDEKYDGYRKRRSVNITENILDNVINGTYVERYNDNYTKNKIEAFNNTIDDLHDELYDVTEKTLATNTYYAPSTGYTEIVFTNSTITRTSNHSFKSNMRDRNMKDSKHYLVTKRPTKITSPRMSRPSKFFADLERPVDVTSAEEDLSSLRKRSPKRRKLRNGKEKPRKAKEIETREGPDDGITRSMYEMYYKARSRSRGVKPQEETRARRRGQARRRLKMRRYKTNEDYSEVGRSSETKMDSHRLDYEEISIPETRDDESEEFGRRRVKAQSNRKEKLRADMPFFITDGGKKLRHFSKHRRGYAEDSQEVDEKDPRAKHERMRTRREREDVLPDYDAQFEQDPQEYERDGYRRKRAATVPEETSDLPTLEAAENPEEPDYVITLRPTQIRTFIIHFENSFRGSAYT